MTRKHEYDRKWCRWKLATGKPMFRNYATGSNSEVVKRYAKMRPYGGKYEEALGRGKHEIAEDRQ